MIIILVHNTKSVSAVLDESLTEITGIAVGDNIIATLKIVAKAYPDYYIIWCHKDLLDSLNIKAMSSIFHHKRIMASFNVTSESYWPDQLEYVNQSCFLKIKRKVTYPTWVMSSQVGGISSSVLLKEEKNLKIIKSFDYFLNSLSKLAMDQGLICYSEPNLLISSPIKIDQVPKASTYTLFKFVKQHYKWSWVFFLATSYLMYEKRFVLLPLLKSMFYKKIDPLIDLAKISINSSRSVVSKREIDVIIPTIGRKQYLHDVLKDLAKQTILPKNVIIVEQNPNKDSVSELNYLKDESWPFNIKHTFTHQAGVCNARNVALSHVTSEWTLLGDDDNRFAPDLIENLFDRIEQYGVKTGITVYLQPEEIQTYIHTAQTGIFGAGNAILKSDLLDKIRFDKRYEFNYGEDSDFGQQIRDIGEDVLFFADVKITHLKAPMGGYRTKIEQKWDGEAIMPKPSPTIQLLYQKQFTTKQLLGYKLILALRSYKNSSVKNPFLYYKKYNAQWEESEKWTNYLRNN